VVAAPLAPEESPYEEMKRYVRFDGADERALLELYPHATPLFERLAIEFYERIREHEKAHDVLKSEAQIERLKRSLVTWLHRFFRGTRDDAYFEETAAIGRVHVQVGLRQPYMLTAMSLIRSALAEAAGRALGARAAAVSASLHRALDLELAVMMGAYHDDHVARVRRMDRIELEQMDRTLAKTEHRYRYAVEQSRVIFMGLDARGDVRLFNREAERVTGFGREEILGTPFADLLPEGVREEHGPLFELAASGGGPAPDTLGSCLRTRSGKVRDVQWQLAYSPSESDEEIALFVIGLDKTDENALNARLRRSEKLAAVGTLAAGLAHEIRNPLNGAQLHLTFLERGMRRAGMNDPDAHDAVRVVGEEIRRLSELVSEFLDFARPSPLDTQPSSLRALCERAVELVAPVADESGVRVALDLPEIELTLAVDSAKIEQVLLNLLQNAVEATAPTGGGSVILRARRQPRHAVIEVEDDGPGLPGPNAPIFDAFFSTKPQGTGLGLAIAHRIVTDHGGSIDVTSHPGRTIFRIALPIRHG
jgi:PAS domain S-box-containing protein